MEPGEKDKESSTPRLLPPIDASYQLSRAIFKIPATSSLEEILAILERDGGVILTDFASLEKLDKIDEEPWALHKAYCWWRFLWQLYWKKTLVIPGSVSKSDTIANILDTNEII